jgi:mono/diheme cytochrome c family protein
MPFIGVLTLFVLLTAATPSVSPVATADLPAGARIFADHCANCHGSDGKGGGTMIHFLATVRRANLPIDLTSTSVMRAWTDEQLAAVIANGGKAMGGSTLMPAYQDKLSAEQIANLVAYIRSLSQ